MPWQTEISSDKLTVKLDLRRCSADEAVDAGEVLSALKESGVAAGEELLGVIGQALTSREETRPVLLRGRAPKAGEDGWFEWSPQCDPERHGGDLAEDRSSHYSRSSIVLVGQGEVIGVLHAPTAGEEGQNVFGEAIPAQAGREHKMVAGRNVELSADGRTFTARCEGQPRLVGTNLSVEPVITINSDVDFGTGNIEYTGSVEIRGDIKELFEVHAGGEVRVGGMVESAQVTAGGDMVVQRGINGKGKGSVRVGGHLQAKYLSNVTAWVKRDVRVHSEIVNGEIHSRGGVHLERGAIHGGSVTAGGTIRAPELGSPMGVRTVIQAGVDPFRQRLWERVREERQGCDKQLGLLMPRARMLLAASGGRPGPELQKLAREVTRLKERLAKLERQERRLTIKLRKGAGERIIVQKMVYPGVVLAIGSVLHHVNKAITGPLEIVADPSDGDVLRFRGPAREGAGAAN